MRPSKTRKGKYWLQESLDLEEAILTRNTHFKTPVPVRVIVDPSECCPKGHFLKGPGGDCLFCRNWLKQIKMGYAGVPQSKPSQYKRRDIGADYGGSGTLR